MVTAASKERAGRERLIVLVKELAEAQQAAANVLRFGWDGTNPDRPEDGTNQEHLEQELADLLTSVLVLTEAADIRPVRLLEQQMDAKLARLEVNLREPENVEHVQRLRQADGYGR